MSQSHSNKTVHYRHNRRNISWRPKRLKPKHKDKRKQDSIFGILFSKTWKYHTLTIINNIENDSFSVKDIYPSLVTKLKELNVDEYKQYEDSSHLLKKSLLFLLKAFAKKKILKSSFSCISDCEIFHISLQFKKYFQKLQNQLIEENKISKDAIIDKIKQNTHILIEPSTPSEQSSESDVDEFEEKKTESETELTETQFTKQQQLLISGLYCKECDISCKSQITLQTHFRSNQHLIKIGNGKYCSLCDVECNSLYDLQIHFDSQTHCNTYLHYENIEYADSECLNSQPNSQPAMYCYTCKIQLDPTDTSVCDNYNYNDSTSMPQSLQYASQPNMDERKTGNVSVETMDSESTVDKEIIAESDRAFALVVYENTGVYDSSELQIINMNVNPFIIKQYFPNPLPIALPYSLNGTMYYTYFGDQIEHYTFCKVQPNYFEYNYKQHTLILGECDFSFTKAIIIKRGKIGINLCATALTSGLSDINRINLRFCIENKCKISFDINAKLLHLNEEKWNDKHGCKFDRILFTFPRIFETEWDKTKYNQNNTTLIHDLLQSCKQYLNKNGEIHMMLFKNQFKHWRLNRSLSLVGLNLSYWCTLNQDLLKKYFNPYEPRDLHGKSFEFMKECNIRRNLTYYLCSFTAIN